MRLEMQLKDGVYSTRMRPWVQYPESKYKQANQEIYQNCWFSKIWNGDWDNSPVYRMFALQAQKIWSSVPCRNAGHSSTYIHTNICTTVSYRRDGDRRFPGAHWQTNLSYFMSARFSDTVSKEVSGVPEEGTRDCLFYHGHLHDCCPPPHSNRTDLFSCCPTALYSFARWLQ